MIQTVVDFLVQITTDVKVFFHYFIVYFCIYLLHEDTKVGRLSLLHCGIFFLIGVLPIPDEYFFTSTVGHEVLLIFTTVMVIVNKRAIYLIILSSFSISMNVLMYQFPSELSILYENYILINRVFLETTLAILLYDQKSKRRNIVIFLIMLLIYTHEF